MERMRSLPRFLLVLAWLGLSCAEAGAPPSALGEPAIGSMWARLLTDAEQLALPTMFLKAIPPDFVRFEFDDLRAYAAEYHPGEHRMVLNRSLSFNAAGGVLKPLTKMTHKELEVLYHELFHAYMDYLGSAHGRSAGAGDASPGLTGFARTQQVCRYGDVAIVPVAQRPHETEQRYLTEAESWEALNETWAVFIGWAIWNQLEVQRKGGGSMLSQERLADRWARRFTSAFLQGEFRGYYVPQDADERRITHKRYLGKASQLSWGEAVVLMGQVLGFPEDFVNRLRRIPELSTVVSAPAPC
jgi:hypothetical protein